MSVARLDSVKVGGLNVRFQHAGSGPALVLVHGLLGYSFSWRFVLPILAKDRHVFAPDMPGAGFSDCDGSLDCGVMATAERLAQFLEAIGIKEWDLLGSSYGGTTSLMLACQKPTQTRTLTLVSPANPWSTIGRKRLALLNIPTIGSLFPACGRMFRPLHSYFVRRMYGDPRVVKPDTLRGYALPLARPGVLEHGVKIAQSWSASMSRLETELSAATIIPTLIVWGTKDRLVDPSSGHRLAKHFRNPKIEMIEGAGHLPYEERPEEFCGIVQSFLAEHSPARELDGK